MAPSAISYLEFTLVCVWDIAPFCFQRREWQGDGFLRAPGNTGQLVPEFQSLETLASKLGSGLSFWAMLFSDLVGKLQKLPGNRFWLSEAIGLVLCQDVPDRHKELARNTGTARQCR